MIAFQSTPKEELVPASPVAVPLDWPHTGVVEFRNLKIRYRPELPLVLKGLTAKINAQEKVGIMGRTGAGKSSLLTALFRIVEPEAPDSILIDGVDIQAVGIREMRASLSVIPQNPVLFEGTIRNNLDPFSEYTDERIWGSLEKVQLYDFVNTHPSKLEMPVSESGENLSQGQKQLICIARALLKPTKILCLDEATSGVDAETDALIQRTIREYCKDQTVLTIAHRLETIVDSDRIMVLNDGIVEAFDTPENLRRQGFEMPH